MISKRFFVILPVIFLFVLGLSLPANAAPSVQQGFSTPTPGADGRILYIVQPGDSCTRVGLLHGISVDQLRQLNSKLDENCTLTAGDTLLIGIVSTDATPTVGPDATLAPPTASPTPFTGTTIICVLLFEDINGNTLRDDGEPAIGDGAISVTEVNGEYTASKNTIASIDPEYRGECFEDVPEGTYNITVGVPENYNATMDFSRSLEVNAGDLALANFGVQSQAIVADPNANPQNESSGTSPLLGILGAIFLLGGAGLGYYAWRSGRPESKLAGRSGFLRK